MVAPGAASGGARYDRFAAVYDAVYAWKDYAAEARRLRALVRKYGPHPARTLLDVACATGHHLEHLAPWFDVTGVDRSAAMLAVARRRLPKVRFVRGSMEHLPLPERFDAITCLFSAIGYVRSESGLRATLRSFATHLNPGGVAIVEPWITPHEFRPGKIRLLTAGTPERPIVRMSTDRVRGGRSIIDFHFLAATPSGVDRWVERHDMGLFSRAEMRRAFERAGLEVHRLEESLTGERGLYLGIRR
jgi:SAM-dependent methyltransferase